MKYKLRNDITEQQLLDYGFIKIGKTNFVMDNYPRISILVNLKDGKIYRNSEKFDEILKELAIDEEEIT